MEETGSEFIGFIKIKRKSWRNLEASGDDSFFLVYPIEASENSVQRWITELNSLRIKINETYPVDEIDEPFIVLNKK